MNDYLKNFGRAAAFAGLATLAGCSSRPEIVTRVADFKEYKVTLRDAVQGNQLLGRHVEMERIGGTSERPHFLSGNAAGTSVRDGFTQVWAEYDAAMVSQNNCYSGDALSRPGSNFRDCTTGELAHAQKLLKTAALVAMNGELRYDHF